MKTGRRNRKTSRLLTLHLDGQLEGAERERIRGLIETDEQVRREFEELRRMRDLLSSREPIPANPWLPERIVRRIGIGEGIGDESLPVPRRFMPAAVTAFSIVLVAVAAIAWLQRDQLIRYVSDTGAQMQQTYQDTILKGWIMPLFQRTSQDQVLEFAMFGTLPLDTQDGTVLRVDENSDRGYRVELASHPSVSRPPATIAELYDEIQPTVTQRKSFDTLFHYAQQQLESAVLMNQAREIAVNPAIGRFNTVILSGIAASLESDQLKRFERFLETRNTPYTFVAQRIPTGAPPPPPPQQVLEQFRSVSAPEEFVVLNERSFTVMRLRLDMDSLRRLMKQLEDRLPRMDVRVQDLARRHSVAAVEDNRVEGRRTEIPTPPRSPRGISVSQGSVEEGGHTISISIDADGEMFREMEREFEKLKRQIVVFRREGERFGERSTMREVENAIKMEKPRRPVPPQPPIPPRRPDRLRFGVSPDSQAVIRMDFDSAIRIPGELQRAIRLDLLELLKEIHADSTFDR